MGQKLGFKISEEVWSSDLVDCKKAFLIIFLVEHLYASYKSIKGYGNRLYGLQEIGCLMIHMETINPHQTITC